VSEQALNKIPKLDEAEKKRLVAELSVKFKAINYRDNQSEFVGAHLFTKSLGLQKQNP
jgi:hypothetical protein